MASILPRLPDDVIVLEILTRLPVKSLIKFRSVSKSWNVLFSSNQFTKIHLKNYSKLHHRLMIDYPAGNVKHCDIESMFADEPLFDVIETNNLFDVIETNNLFDSSRKKLFMGSCDGLILVNVYKKYLVLWNPSTREFKKLPSFGFDATLSCGLGFDKNTDDYKVVVFLNDGNAVMVYSLRTDEWRSIRNWNDRVFVVGSSVFANGKLHWVALSGSEQVIVSFDLETEEFVVLKLPNNVQRSSCLRVCASEGCLYLLSLRPADVWIIVVYELRKLTCTKLAKIPLENENKDWTTLYRLLVYVKKNGEILLRSGKKIVVFNASDCTSKWLDVSMPEVFYDVITYAESLVSPFMR